MPAAANRKMIDATPGLALQAPDRDEIASMLCSAGTYTGGV
jgi:hypothetical protein